MWLQGRAVFFEIYSRCQKGFHLPRKDTTRQQKMPPQCMPLHHKDYIELKATEKKQIEESSLSSSYLLKVKVLVTQSCPTLRNPRLLCPWAFLGKNTGVGCHALLQGIFPTLGIESGTQTWQANSSPSRPPGKPLYLPKAEHKCTKVSSL